MNAIRVLKHIDSDLVHIPELRAMMGQDVEITIRTRTPAAGGDEPLETLETFLGAALHRPAPSEEEMDELRSMAKTEPAIAAALRMAERGGLDVETILGIRNADR
ncbi:MAG TPA: hypothetical protein VLK84_06580 [Longimicrobium sp.]|nr:hypothetical protein [Longimicrobium sp.]